jgi:hypothetical protein
MKGGCMVLIEKKPCVFPKEENRGMGDRIFFYAKTEESIEFVRVYEFEEDDKYVIIVHESKIKPVTNEMYEPKFGALYLKDEYGQFR